jgi:hypothetical protein
MNKTVNANRMVLRPIIIIIIDRYKMLDPNKLLSDYFLIFIVAGKRTVNV